MWIRAMLRDQARSKVDAGVNRRRMLLGSVAAVPAAMATPAQALEDLGASNQTADPHQPSYRETEHIRTFYDRSRF
jgi:hypothetical protein